MERDEEASGLTSHWVVLAGGLLTAASLWYWWLTGGMDWGHRMVLERIPAPLAASAPLPPASSASVPLSAMTVEAATSPEPTASARERIFTELGQTGDAFGSLNALLTAVAGALVAWAGFMQHQTLKQARREAKAERESRKVQQFESLFFQLLGLSAAATERIQGPRRKPGSPSRFPRSETDQARLAGPKGPPALDAYAQMIFKGVTAPLLERQADPQLLGALVSDFLTDVYDKRPSTFGPYFRLLYQTFKHIHESPLTPACAFH